MISAIVATYGRSEWRELAQRAVGSLMAQTVAPVDIQQTHGRTLAEARNDGALNAKGEWLLFVDADDCVDEHYVEAMTKVIVDQPEANLLLQPATSALYPDGSTDGEPNIIPRRYDMGGTLQSLRRGNWMVIGTVVRRDIFLRAGGFWEEPCMEDWSLWLRCAALGARDIAVPDAVYLVFQKPGGRNSSPPRSIFNDITVSFQRWCSRNGIDFKS